MKMVMPYQRQGAGGLAKPIGRGSLKFS